MLQMDSVFNLRRPYDLVAFMRQEERAHMLGSLKKELLSRKSEIDRHEDKDSGRLYFFHFFMITWNYVHRSETVIEATAINMRKNIVSVALLLESLEIFVFQNCVCELRVTTFSMNICWLSWCSLHTMRISGIFSFDFIIRISAVAVFICFVVKLLLSPFCVVWCSSGAACS